MNARQWVNGSIPRQLRLLGLLLGLLVLGTPAYSQTTAWIERSVEAPPLGTFAPTPYIMAGGAAPTSFGYSPLGRYGDASMAVNGPFSPMRSISAPVRVYNRGYDGVLREETATSFSNPNLPVLSPFVYPTQSNYYYGPRVNRTPPWWDHGANWIDHR